MAPIKPKGMPKITASKMAQKHNSRVGGSTVKIVDLKGCPPL